MTNSITQEMFWLRRFSSKPYMVCWIWGHDHLNPD